MPARAKSTNRGGIEVVQGLHLGAPNVLVVATTGTPVDGTSGTFVGQAGPGSLLLSSSTKKAYVNTGTIDSPTWTAQA